MEAQCTKYLKDGCIYIVPTCLLRTVIGLPPSPVTTIAPRSVMKGPFLKVAILPPTLSFASSTTMSMPKDLSCCAAASPAIPAPIRLKSENH